MKKLIRGAGGGGGKMGGGEQHTPVEAPDTLHSVARARIVDLISEGECVGLEDGLEDIFLDWTPVMNADGSFNFKNVYVDTRTGTQDQEPLPNFPEVESETAVGVLLETTTPWTHLFTNLSLTGVRIRLAVPALMETDTETGDTSGYVIEYAMDLAIDGGPFIELFVSAFSGKASSLFERGHTIDLPPATTGWTIRVRRLTLESSSISIQDEVSVQSFTELIAANLRMPNSALVAISIDASQFRNIPTRAYRFKGRIIRVPSNYDPITRIYTGVWDGTFQSAWSDNPAWIYFDMATHYRYGLGRYLDNATLLVDKWELYSIGQYCDELVDDGLGGTEPRFTCNLYLQKAADAYKVMQDLASVFRGICYWAAGVVVAVADKPQDSIYTYTNANVIDGRFSYQGTSRQARHTVALVEWSDPLDFGRGKLEYVPYETGIARYGIQPLNVTAIGATSQGQAHRCGNWILLSENLRNNTVTFSVGLDGAIPQPGKYIRIADKLRAGVRIGGRVRAATTTVITPDAMPTVAIGNSLTIILPTGVAQTRTVSAVGASTITVSPAYSDAPGVDSVWAIESVAVPAEVFRVIGVKEDDGIQFTVMALKHDAAVFTDADFGITIQQPSTANAPITVIAPPAAVTVAYERIEDGVIARQAVVSEWSAVTGAVAYEVSFKRNISEWSVPQRVNGRRFEIPNALPGDYRFRVKAITSTGLASLERLSDTTPVEPLEPLEPLSDYDTGELLFDMDSGSVLTSA